MSSSSSCGAQPVISDAAPDDKDVFLAVWMVSLMIKQYPHSKLLCGGASVSVGTMVEEVNKLNVGGDEDLVVHFSLRDLVAVGTI